MSKALATKNVAAVLVAAALILGFAFAFATPAKADTLSDLQAQVQALLAQIASLQGGSSSSTTSSGAGCYTFTANLKPGSTGGEVMWVQKFLNNHGFQVAASGAGSPGNETSYFGPATKAAVIKFQNANAADILTPVGLTAGTGNWFAATRAKANAMCAGAGTGTGTGTGTGVAGSLSVGMAAQPANSLAPEGASRVPFTTFTLTNNSGAAVTVNSVSVQRTGFADDAVFSGGGVILVDEAGMQLGVQRTLNSDHTVMAGDPFVINPGQTKTITVAGNMSSSLDSYTGQVISLSVTGINTNGTVSGVLPITGASHTVNSNLTIGTVTPGLSSFDPNSAQTKNIGDSGIKFGGVKFTAGSGEDVKLFSVRWRLNGTVSSGDLANVTAVVDGTSYPVTVSSDGRYYTVSIPGGLLIQKGFNKDIYIQGDIVGSNASGRIVEFDIDRKSDVYFVGQTYGYGIQPDSTTTGSLSTASTHGSVISSSQPWFQGSTVSVSGASITTIGKANEVAAQNIAVNVPNQVLGGFATDLKGEGITVQQLVFTVASSTSAAGDTNLTNVSLVNESGAVVAGPVDESAGTVTFTNAVTFPVGRHVYTLKGKVDPQATDGKTYTVSTTPSSGWTSVTGVTTGNTVSLSGSGAFSMNVMTVRAASLAAAVSATPAAQTITAGTADFTFANIQYDASQSGEDVRVSNLPMNIDGAIQLSMLSSCRVYDGATNLTTGGNVVNPSATSTNFVFDNSIMIAKGTLKTLAVKCNLSSSAASGATVTFGLGTLGTNVNATGVTSGNSVSVSGSTGGGQQMTIGTASLAVSIDATSPSYAIVAGGTSGATVGIFKFRASNDAVSLQRVGLVLTSGAAADVSNVTLWKGGVQIGSANFAAGSTHATSTLSSPVTLDKDTDVLITVKADTAAIGSSLPGTEGKLIQIDLDTNGTNTQGTGVGSGSTVNASGSTAVAGVRNFKSFPASVALDSSGTLVGGTLMRFKVTADSHGNIGIYKFTFTTTFTNVTVSTVNLYGFTDAGFSTPISGVGSGGLINASPVTSVASGDTYSLTATSSATSAFQVPAGTTYYFELRGTVSPSDATYNAATTLKGDATGTGINNVGVVSGNFIWSPNSTNTSSAVSGGGYGDWTNAAGVVGLPSSGLSQNRTN